MSPGRIAVGVSGTGSNLRALHAAGERGELGGTIRLVFADRACPALDWAAEQGIDTALVAAGADDALVETLDATGPDLVVLAGFMRRIGPRVLDGYRGRILNIHPSLLPAFPGAHAIRDALAHGVGVTGVTVHLVDEMLDGGPIVAQEAVPVLPHDDESSLRSRIQAAEHRLLPRVVALTMAGAVVAEPQGRRVRVDLASAEAQLPPTRRALLSVSDKTGLVALGQGLVARGWELLSTGGTARTLRDAGLPVTDVAAVTGSPEMLDGRVKTLHPRIHAGILADRRLEDHRRQLIAAGIAPIDLVVVNLYPFAAALERPGISVDALIEEIDIGGPSMVRAAAKNHASVTVVTSPARYDDVLAALDAPDGLALELRRTLALEAFAHTAAYDARIAAELPTRLRAAGLLPAVDDDPFPATLSLALEKVDSLRYGENPHQPAARYRRPGTTLDDGLFGIERPPLQGKALSYNNVLDAAAASALGRSLRGPAVVIVKHTNPCGAAERATLLDAWSAALEADPVSAFGGVVAVSGRVDEALAAALTSIFLEIVVAPAYDDAALAVLAAKPNLRVLVDERLGDEAASLVATSPLGSIRSAGGAILVGAPDTSVDDPTTWTVASRRPPSEAEQADLDLAWRLVRGVTSNAIVLVRERRLVGMGSGQTSRVDAARQAVAKAEAMLGPDAAVGAACASDAFFPFADAVEACLDAGVGAFVQPGGSMRDGEVVAAIDSRDATMLLTGTRHFRH